MKGNSVGAYKSTREKDQLAYDALPPTVRYVLRNAAFNFAAEPILEKIRIGRVPPKAM